MRVRECACVCVSECVRVSGEQAPEMNARIF
jgi:hypothetical protein